MLFGAIGLFAQAAVAAARDEERAPRHVELKLITERQGPEPLERVLGELLGRLQVTIHLVRLQGVDVRQILSEHPNDPEAVARVWIDLRERTRVTVYLSGNREDRVLVRHVPIEGHLDEVGREEIAHIVEASVDGLLVGGRIGVATDEPRKTAPAPQAHRPEHALNLELAYQGHAWSMTRGVLHGPALGLAWVAPGRVVRPLMMLSTSVRFPFVISGDPVSARLDQLTFRVLAGADVTIAPRWRLQAAVGAGADWVRISSRSTATSTLVELDPDRTTVVPMARAMIAARFALTSHTDVFGAVGADVSAWDVRYIVARQDADEVLFEPWRVRPFAALGLSVDLLP